MHNKHLFNTKLPLPAASLILNRLMNVLMSLQEVRSRFKVSTSRANRKPHTRSPKSQSNSLIFPKVLLNLFSSPFNKVFKVVMPLFHLSPIFTYYANQPPAGICFQLVAVTSQGSAAFQPCANNEGQKDKSKGGMQDHTSNFFSGKKKTLEETSN